MRITDHTIRRNPRATFYLQQWILRELYTRNIFVAGDVEYETVPTASFEKDRTGVKQFWTIHVLAFNLVEIII